MSFNVIVPFLGPYGPKGNNGISYLRYRPTVVSSVQNFAKF